MKQEIPKQYQRTKTSRKVKVVEIGGKNKPIYDGPGEEVVVDKRLDFPSGNEPILSQLKDTFSCVFIVLHPFIFIDGFDPNKTQVGNLELNRSDIEGDLSIERLNQLREEHNIGREYDFETFEQFEKLSGQKRNWSVVGSSCGFSLLRDIGRAIHTGTTLMLREHEDRDGLKRLSSYCEREKLFLPLRGQSPPSFNDAIAETMRRLSVANVYLSDDLALEKTVKSIDELRLAKTPWSQDHLVKSPIREIYSEDLSVRFATDYESAFTLICGYDELRSIEIESLFEGFWCDSGTRFRWFLNDDEIAQRAPAKGPSISELIEQNTLEYQAMIEKSGKSSESVE